jgi:hypothetical protein
LLVDEALDLPKFNEIEFVASNFPDFDRTFLKSLKRDDLIAVLESDKLVLSSEEALLDFVLDSQEGSVDVQLISLVRTEYLSEDGIDLLLENIRLDEIDGALWASLCRRLRMRVRNPSGVKSRFQMKAFESDSSTPFHGIMHHLIQGGGGSTAAKGVISVTASGTGSFAGPEIVLEASSLGYWHSADTPNSWIQFDFASPRVIVTAYTIKSAGYSTDYPVKWSLDGSTDELFWENLDTRNTSVLKKDGVVKSFSCTAPSPSPFRYIRLTQRGANGHGRHFLQLRMLEFFGDLRDPVITMDPAQRIK